MNLVESVEDIVVSALAQQDRFSSWQLYSPPPKEPDSSVVTRDIIAAIADELDGPSRPMERWAGWDSAIATLRHAQANEIQSQANPDSVESGISQAERGEGVEIDPSTLPTEPRGTEQKMTWSPTTAVDSAESDDD